MSHPISKEILKTRIAAISLFYHEKGRMPSFSELGDLVGLRSKKTVFNLVAKLEGLNVLSRDERGRLIPRSLSASVKVLGTVEAGFPSPAEEELLDTLSLDKYLVNNRTATFLLKVSGESMVEAGIIPGDMVLVDRSRTAKSGDIIIAEVDGAWTMKYLKKRGQSVTLMPANSSFKTIIPKSELKIAGVVTSVIRKYY